MSLQNSVCPPIAEILKESKRILSSNPSEIDFISVYNKVYRLCQNCQGESLFSNLVETTKLTVNEQKSNLDNSSSQDFLTSLLTCSNIFWASSKSLSELCSYLQRAKINGLSAELPLVTILRSIFVTEMYTTDFRDSVDICYRKELLSLLFRETDCSLVSLEFLAFTCTMEKDHISTLYSDLLEIATIECLESYFVAKEESQQFNSFAEVLQHLENIHTFISKLNQVVLEPLKIRCAEMMLQHVERLEVFRNAFEDDLNKAFFDGCSRMLYVVFDMSDGLSEMLIAQYELFLKKKIDHDVAQLKKQPSFSFTSLFDYFINTQRALSFDRSDIFSKANRMANSNKRILERKLSQEEYFSADLARAVDGYIKESLKTKNYSKLVNFAENDFKNIYRLLGEKDIFDIEYRALLQDRMLKNCSLIKETELPFYNVIKSVSGVEQNAKIAKMLNDIFASFKIYLEYKKTKSGYENPLFFVNLLEKDNWSITNTENSNIPCVLDDAITSFTNFYYGHFPHRSLEWVNSRSWAEVKVSLPSRMPFNLFVNAVQLNVVNAFNLKRKVKLNELFTNSGLSNLMKVSFMTNIQPLLDIKLLVADRYALEDETTLKLNYDFEAVKNTYNCISMVKKTQSVKKSSRDEAEGSIERKHQIDTFVMKVVKAARTIRIAEVAVKVEELVRQFTRVTINDVILRVEHLIQRNLIRKNEHEHDLVHYD